MVGLVFDRKRIDHTILKSIFVKIRGAWKERLKNH